jgi:hypothetical protein
MMRKHPATNVIPTASNVIFRASNVIPIASNVILRAPNVSVSKQNNNIDTNQCNTCNLCNKKFSRNYVLKKHLDKCKGINTALQCEYCNIIFSSRQCKSRHLRICKTKKELDSQALVVHTPSELNIENQNLNQNQNINQNQVTSEQSGGIAGAQVINNNMQHSNIQNANTINNNNNNITNIIVFDPEKMELLHDHITKRKFTKMVTYPDFVKILTDYSTELLSRKENQCVRKTNLLSSSSAIHMGNDKWIYQSDKEVLPKLL